MDDSIATVQAYEFAFHKGAERYFEVVAGAILDARSTVIPGLPF
jgi:hypothetical protein